MALWKWSFGGIWGSKFEGQNLRVKISFLGRILTWKNACANFKPPPPHILKKQFIVTPCILCFSLVFFNLCDKFFHPSSKLRLFRKQVYRMYVSGAEKRWREEKEWWVQVCVSVFFSVILFMAVLFFDRTKTENLTDVCCLLDKI